MLYFDAQIFGSAYTTCLHRFTDLLCHLLVPRLLMHGNENVLDHVELEFGLIICRRSGAYAFCTLFWTELQLVQQFYPVLILKHICFLSIQLIEHCFSTFVQLLRTKT